jgi:hypothetical protein
MLLGLHLHVTRPDADARTPANAKARAILFFALHRARGRAVCRPRCLPPRGGMKPPPLRRQVRVQVYL